MKGVEPVLSSNDRDHIIERIQEYLTDKQSSTTPIKSTIRLIAPVSYPFLWDFHSNDYVQWNGRVDNSGIGPMARNAGQVMAYLLHWTGGKGWNNPVFGLGWPRFW